MLYDGELPDFSRKHVMFYMYSKDTYLLQDIRFERYDGRLFVEGRMSEGLREGTWSRGLDATLAWENVRTYLVYDSPEDYRARQEVWKRLQGNVIGRLLRRKK